MSMYETTFITRPNLTQSEVDKLTKAFVEILKKHGGKLVKREYWGLRNLAYTIKKCSKGHYVLLFLDTPTKALAEMESNMRINDDIIRLMSIRVNSVPDKILSPETVTEQELEIEDEIEAEIEATIEEEQE